MGSQTQQLGRMENQMRADHGALQKALQKALATIRNLERDRARRLATCFRARLVREVPTAEGGNPQQINTPLAEIALAEGVEFERLLELIQSGAAEVQLPKTEAEVGAEIAARLTGKLPLSTIAEGETLGVAVETATGEEPPEAFADPEPVETD